MSPLVLAATWAATGVLAAALLSPFRLRRRRMLAAVPLLLAGASLGVTSVAAWPGPAAASGFGASVALGRPGAGLLVAAGVALAVTLLLAPGLDGGEVVTICAVGAGATVMLSATVPIVWALAAAVAVGAVSLRWIAAAPDRATLATGRVLGAGVAALLLAASLLPETVGRADSRNALAGALLAAGVGALLALVPLGGWAASAVATVRGVDLAAWSMLLGPAALLSAGAALPALQADTRTTFAGDLLVLGLGSAIFGGLQALRAVPASRYGRLWIADLALAAAGLGSLQDEGRLGGMLLVLTHLAIAPLLLHHPRPGLERPHRVAWLALAGLPPAPAFWGRLLVLEGLVRHGGGVTLIAGLAAAALTSATAIRGLTATDAEPRGRAAGRVARLLAWAVCLGGVALGLAPGAIAERVFGPGFG